MAGLVLLLLRGSLLLLLRVVVIVGRTLSRLLLLLVMTTGLLPGSLLFLLLAGVVGLHIGISPFRNRSIFGSLSFSAALITRGSEHTHQCAWAVAGAPSCLNTRLPLCSTNRQSFKGVFLYTRSAWQTDA